MPLNPGTATTIYGQGIDAGLNLSPCALLTSYRHDSVAPTISSLSPADNAIAISATANLVITFDEAVDVESGDIVIYRASDDLVIETIPAGDARVTGSGTDTITINPSTALASTTEYYVLIAATAFDDAAGNSFAGVASSTAWSFTTADSVAPTLLSLSPADNSIGVSATANLVLEFSEAVDAESGNIVILRASDDQVIESIPVGDARVTGSGTDTITVNPNSTLASTISGDGAWSIFQSTATNLGITNATSGVIKRTTPE